MTTQHVKLVKNILSGNDEMAEQNRTHLEMAGVLAVNVMASPGSGKTSLISRTIEALKERLNIGVIEGDIAGRIDTERVLEAGAWDAVQINTGGSCHLEANMVRAALDNLDLEGLDLLFVENVGNLVCPTHWSLGEQIKLCILSTPEGHDKPVKYPELFAASDVIILNKIDLIEFVGFDSDFFYDSLGALNGRAPVFELSCRTGAGFPAWLAWLTAHIPFADSEGGEMKDFSLPML